MGQQEDQGRTRKILETSENEHKNPKSVVHSESNPKKEIHSVTGLAQKTRKSSNKQSNFILKGL